jgi:hypothetical protein
VQPPLVTLQQRDEMPASLEPDTGHGAKATSNSVPRQERTS